ncbi:hypothetical protein BDN67DRAFT_985357 [Paxillus ammoniavirescens]|nr:hypothetical protein BDN67DRAFT_985357 [Paxillus ammoniavirescens]
MPHSLFTEEQLTLLEGVLDEYCEISGQGKVARKEAIVTRVTWQFVTVHHENDIEATKKLQNSMKNWLNNQSRELTGEEEYFQKTNWFTVFTSKNADQIKEETRKLTEVAPGLPGEQQTYVDLAVEWNTKGVPKDVQMKHLMNALQTGQITLDIIPLTGIDKDVPAIQHKDDVFWGYESDGEIFRGMHDHNDSLDDGLAVKKVCPNWDKEPIGSTWETYLKNAFNTTKQVSSPMAADPKQKFELRKAEDGHWDLPPDDFLSASLELQKRLVRDSMNCCWQGMAGRKGSAPFSKMTKDLAEFVNLDASYLPDRPSLEIKDPSYMSKDDVESILRHWKERQENQFLQPIFTFKDTAKQSQKTTECTLLNITQVMPCNVTPAIPPPNDSPKSAVALSQQSKVGEPLPNAKPTVKVSTPTFSQTEHNHGLIDNSSSKSSSDSDESENTVELWQCPNQHGATVESQVRTGSVEDALPGGLDWKYDNFHLPLEGHRWLPKHESAFGGDLFTMTGEVHGRAHLVAQALFAGMLIRDAKMVVGGRTPLCGYPFIPPELKGKMIPGHYISGYILPCPADVKGKWHEACNFMLSLSSDKQYRQLVMSLEQIDNSGSPDQDCARRIPLSDFSWDTNSHHAGDCYKGVQGLSYSKASIAADILPEEYPFFKICKASTVFGLSLLCITVTVDGECQHTVATLQSRNM